MAKQKSARKTAHKSKKMSYKAETYGIKYDSVTFLLLAIFVLAVSVWLVSGMMGIKIF